MRTPASLLAVALLTGCASNAIRPTALGTMQLSQGLKGEMVAFASRQNVEMQTRRSDIADLNEATALSRFTVRKQMLDWQAQGNQAAIQTFGLATKDGEGTELASQLTSRLLQSVEPKPRLAIDSSAYDGFLGTLKPLATKRSPIEDARFLIEFGQAVVSKMKDDVKTAAEADTGNDAPASPAAAIE